MRDERISILQEIMSLYVEGISEQDKPLIIADLEEKVIPKFLNVIKKFLDNEPAYDRLVWKAYYVDNYTQKEIDNFINSKLGNIIFAIKKELEKMSDKERRKGFPTLKTGYNQFDNIIYFLVKFNNREDIEFDEMIYLLDHILAHCNEETSDGISKGIINRMTDRLVHILMEESLNDN